MDRRKLLAWGAGTTALTATGSLAASAPAGATAVPSDRELAQALPGFRSRHAQVNGIRLHYVIGGSGDPLVLLHGWPETWWEYHKVMPALAAQFQVIAVDLRGIGGSDKPQSGYDKKTMALDIRELAHHLGHDEINIAGHDIGAQVAFSFAANHPEATRRVAILDVTHPDESYYATPLLVRPDSGRIGLWWHAFNQVRELPEQLVSGRAHYLVNWILDTFLRDPAAISPFDRALYTLAYNFPDGIRGSNGWYQGWHQDIVDLAGYDKVTAPMLGLAHDAFFDLVDQVLPTQGTDVRVELVPDAGHYFVEEQPATVVQALTDFFG